MLRRRGYIARQCSVVEVQGMIGYFIREKDLRATDVSFLQDNGYKVYGMRAQENHPYTIENKIAFRGRAGVVAFPAPIKFPIRADFPRDSAMNYYTLNNQHSRFNPEVIEHSFSSLVKSQN